LLFNKIIFEEKKIFIGLKKLLNKYNYINIYIYIFLYIFIYFIKKYLKYNFKLFS
jgi:hypothetical protein